MGGGFTIPATARGVGVCFLLSFVLSFLPPRPAAAQTELPALSEAEAPPLPVPARWKGDFDGMKERRRVRILVPFSKTIYFLDKGAERGTAAETGRQFETCINTKYKTSRKGKIHITFVPVARDQLFTDLNEGLGDIVAASLTITAERRQIVDFGDPALTNISQLIVTGPSAPVLTRLEDLAGQEIQVRKTSSYWTHLQALSNRFEAEGLKRITLIPADENLEDEDLLEMVNAELLPFTVVDSYKARLWIIFSPISCFARISPSTPAARSPGPCGRTRPCCWRRSTPARRNSAQTPHSFWRSCVNTTATAPS